MGQAVARHTGHVCQATAATTQVLQHMDVRPHSHHRIGIGYKDAAGVLGHLELIFQRCTDGNMVPSCHVGDPLYVMRHLVLLPHVSLMDCASCRSQGKNHDPVLVDLIDKLLRLNPADRLTAEQVFQAAPISHMTFSHRDLDE